MLLEFDLSLTIVVPLYNEEGNLEFLHKQLQSILPSSTKIIYVDDDSSDKSLEILRRIGSFSEQVLVIHNNERLGLGLSIFRGIIESDSEFILLMDSDLTHNPMEIPRLIQNLEKASLVIASRYMRGGGMKPYRLYYSSKLFSQIIRLLFGIETKDLFGGFLLFRRNHFHDFLIESNFLGFGEYSMRMCLYAENKGIPICEVPSIFAPRRGGVKKSLRIQMVFNYFLATKEFARSLRK